MLKPKLEVPGHAIGNWEREKLSLGWRKFNKYVFSTFATMVRKYERS